MIVAERIEAPPVFATGRILISFVAIILLARQVALGRDTARIEAPGSSQTEPGSLISRAADLLVHQTAAAMTAELNGAPYDRASLARKIDDGMSSLQQARVALEKQDVAAAQKEDRRRIEVLTAFGESWRALAAFDGSPEAAEQLLTTGIELALYVDDPDPHIAEAAQLWQAHAYRKAGRPDRALQLLKPILAARSGRALDLFARLERCRALADAGHYVASIALAIKVEGKLDTWLQREPPQARKSARHTVRLLRAEILKRWAVRLRDESMDVRATEAERLAGVVEAESASKTVEPLMLDALIVGWGGREGGELRAD